MHWRKASQDPRQSRGLEEALEGHDTDNAPKGASNGSANCIADSWRAPWRGVLLCLGILATRKRVYELLYAHLIRYLICLQLLFDIFLYLLFISSYCIHEISSCPEMPVSIFILQICMPVEDHQTAFSFEISHYLWYTILWWDTDEHVDMMHL